MEKIISVESGVPITSIRKANLSVKEWGRIYDADIVKAEHEIYIVQDPADFSGLPNIIGTFFFTFQIYCDFSGYSDIAIGAAFIMGYRLMTNFRRPYLSMNIREFW